MPSRHSGYKPTEAPPRLVPVDLRIWASVEQGRGRYCVRSWAGVGGRIQSVSKSRSHGRTDIDLCRQCGCITKLQGGILTTAIVVLLRSPRARLCISTSAGRGSERPQAPNEFRRQRRVKIAGLAVGATEHTMSVITFNALVADLAPPVPLVSSLCIVATPLACGF